MENRKWYENAFIYQIYPRSYADSNNDGIGDLRGITSKLDYLKDLGVDAIWISPFYSSPLYDCGYDISDYCNIAPEYGTMDDFDRLVSEAHDRGIRVLMDLVVNHTSVEHEWFKKAVAEAKSKYHDFYFWRKLGEFKDGASPEGSGYGDSVWYYVPENDEYYLHTGYDDQPDLNWDNPEVRDEICNAINFWLDRGIDGFRCDVIYLISKEPTLTEFGMGPHLHEYLHELYKRCFEPHNAITVAEVWEQDPATTLTMIGDDREELTMSFYFTHIGLGREGRFIKTSFEPNEFIDALAKWQYGINGKANNTLVLENHDQSRIVSRFGNTGKYRAQSAELLAAMTFLMKGTSFIYQGQELGLVNPTFHSLDDIKDIETLDYIKDMRGRGEMTDAEILEHVNFGTRDVGRIPMPWNGGKYYGFSDVKPWLWGDADYSETNVESEEKRGDSTLNFFKKLIRLKKENEVLSYGDFELIDNSNKFGKGFFRYERTLDGKKCTVLGNFSDKDMERPDLGELASQTILLSNYPDSAISDRTVLRPYEIIVTQG